MRLKNILSAKESSILEKWFELVVESYPAETRRFLKGQKNRFANPVGTTILRELGHLLKELLEGEISENSVSDFLENVIKIRAIQEFTPSDAVEFIFSLKKVIRQELVSEIEDGETYEELLKLESRIDDLGLLAFDMYVKCREKVYEIKANELRNRSRVLLERFNLMGTTGEGE